MCANSHRLSLEACNCRQGPAYNCIAGSEGSVAPFPSARVLQNECPKLNYRARNRTFSFRPLLVIRGACSDGFAGEGRLFDKATGVGDEFEGTQPRGMIVDIGDDHEFVGAGLRNDRSDT